MRVLFAGGGTGGHLIPGVALAQSLRASGDEALFLTAGRSLEASLLGEIPFVDLALERGRGAPGMASAAARLPGAATSAISVVARWRPAVVVGLGGLASVPGAIAARVRRVPLALLEINAIPGRATRWLAPLARRVFVSSEEAARRLRRRAVLTGTPLRPEFESPPARAQARAQFGLDRDRPTVLVLGGSQGAAAVNRAVAGALEAIEARGAQLLWVTGPGKEEEARAACSARPKLRASVRGYVREAAAACAAADLAVCRSGAATVAELGAMGLPSIAIPYPHHRDRQQFWNARLLGEGTRVVEEESLARGRLGDEIGSLLDRPDALAAMGEACRRSARPRARETALEALRAMA
ncbi:MAG TPA: UDP-N-acetylglucosamine--N-acetylmuramyl-(pentapeptide) pyrophosphoryl-undecaprenol N-acetylglucosamine transferase [Planctomycetota bacterium]|nr:UDP-N-acetylglucosamine--N-acetylmuramyl-(pentapeptide) pyrophosphoryl-undecaprenol N-acetylglucosamine transferase [Planctomycetota bacterium]